LAEYFLRDPDLQSEAPRQPYFIPSRGDLVTFRLARKLTEQALINLGFTTGFIQKAWEYDEYSVTASPISVARTYSFELQLRSDLDQVIHREQGQVQIDALILGRRAGHEVLFVFEAKTDNSQSLAKHKLVYPLLAISQQVQDKFPIIPFYLRIKRDDGVLIYCINECSFPGFRPGRNRSIGSLTPGRTKCFHFAWPWPPCLARLRESKRASMSI